MAHTRAKTIGDLKAKSVADEKKIRDLEDYKKWGFTIRKANFKRHIEDKARIAELRLEVSDVKKKMAEMAEELQTLKTQLGSITEV